MCVPRNIFSEVTTIIIYSHCYSVVENFKRLPLSLLILCKPQLTVCPEIVQKMMTSSKRTTHNGLLLFCVRCLLRMTEMLIHFKTSENCFFSIVKGFWAIFITKSTYRSAHVYLFPTIDCCNPLAFPKRHGDFPIGMTSHDLISWIRLGWILNHYLICESSGNIWILILTQFEVKWTAPKQTITEGLHHILS